MARRFLAVQLFAAIAVAFASDFLPPGTPARMKWKPPTRWCKFVRLTQQLANPHEGE
jgi:peptidoglycan/LPS O-acetylase OafA/YrhL